MTSIAALPERVRPELASAALGVREAPRADRLRSSRRRLPDAPDRRRDPLLVQRARRAASTTSGRGSRSTTGSTGTQSLGIQDADRSRRSRSACSRPSSPPSLGTLIALAIVRHRFVGRGATNLLVFLPMSTPEIVLGASLLTLFLNTTASSSSGSDDLHRARDVHRQLHRRDREGAPDRLRPPPRGGGDGPRRQRGRRRSAR